MHTWGTHKCIQAGGHENTRQQSTMKYRSLALCGGCWTGAGWLEVKETAERKNYNITDKNGNWRRWIFSSAASAASAAACVQRVKKKEQKMHFGSCSNYCDIVVTCNNYLQLTEILRWWWRAEQILLFPLTSNNSTNCPRTSFDSLCARDWKVKPQMSTKSGF